MNETRMVIAAVLIGLAAASWLLVAAIHGTADACRAANPGYDCDIGWVKGEVFK